MTLLHLNEPEIGECTDLSDAWELLKSVPRMIINAEEMITLCFKPRPYNGSMTRWLFTKDAIPNALQQLTNSESRPHISKLFSHPSSGHCISDSDFDGKKAPALSCIKNPKGFQKRVGRVTGTLIEHYKQMVIERNKLQEYQAEVHEPYKSFVLFEAHDKTDQFQPFVVLKAEEIAFDCS
jgi:hypothetical protein